MKRWEIYLEIFMEIIIFAAIMAFIIFGLPKLLAFFWPVVAAGILAVITNPIKKFLEDHIRMPKRIGATLMVILLLVLVSFTIYGLIVGAIEGVKSLYQVLPELYAGLEESLRDVVDRVSVFVNGFNPDAADKIMELYVTLGNEIGTMIAGLGTQSVGLLSGIASSVANLAVGTIVMFMSAYFLLIYYDNIRYFFHEMKNEKFRKNLKLISENVLGVVGKYFLSQIKLMLIIAVILCIGLLILQRNQPVLLAFLISLLDAIPFFGTGTVLCPWALVCLIQGDFFVAIGLLILYVICLLSRQILQPKIIGDTIGINPFVTLLLMYTGMKLAGLVGFVLAVVIGMVVYRLYEIGMFDGMIKRMKHRFLLLSEVE